MFGLFRKRELLSRIAIRVSEDFEETKRVSVALSKRLDPVYVALTWAMYYAKTLFSLGECAASEGVKAHLEAWAEPCAIPAAGRLPLLPDMLVIDPEISLGAIPAGTSEDYTVDVLAEKDGPPIIQTDIPGRGHQNRMAVTVIALAQHFIDEYGDAIGGELALYTLGMRKHYRALMPYTKKESLIAIPSAAAREVLNVYELGRR